MKRRHAPLLLLALVAILAAPAASQVGSVQLHFSPANPQAGDDVTLTATVTGGTGAITVEYRRSNDCTDVTTGELIGVSVIDPYTVSLGSNLPAGSYPVKAVATDTTTDPPACDAATITVSDPPPPPEPNCNDNQDNDSDGQTDYPNDPGCQSAQDDTEFPNPQPSTAPSLTLRALGGSTYVAGQTVYVNPTGTGSYRVTASTSESGIDAARFPIFGVQTSFVATYAVDDFAASGAQDVTAVDNHAQPTDGPASQFNVVLDTTGPAEVAVSYVDGNDTDGVIEVTTSDGIDAGAGVNPASGLLERALGTLTDTTAGPTCTNLGAWQQTPPTNTIPRLQCAFYRYTVEDNLGNASTDTGVAAVWFDDRDITDPANVTNARLRTGDHVVRLTYRTPTADFDRVKIFRSIAGVGGSERLAFNGRAQRFVDRSVLNGTRYVYEIVTYDAAGNRPDLGVFMRGRPKSRFLLSPRDGATLRRPPLLDWRARKRARFYNVKLLRDIGPGPAREVLSKFPRRSKLQLHRTWRHKGRVQRFRAGTYYWYVWPRIGGHYGRLMGWQRFVVPRG